MRNRRVPVILQIDALECGADCLAMVCATGNLRATSACIVMSSDFRILLHRGLGGCRHGFKQVCSGEWVAYKRCGGWSCWATGQQTLPGAD
jgi:hypothetical protein